ncbi:hypothetical protein H8959_012230 [Pygathrix nigripes]
MIIEVSSSEEEESTISEGDNVESWMLLGCEVDDKDDDILLNLVGCENSVTEGGGYQYFEDGNLFNFETVCGPPMVVVMILVFN